MPGLIEGYVDKVMFNIKQSLKDVILWKRIREAGEPPPLSHP